MCLVLATGFDNPFLAEKLNLYPSCPLINIIHIEDRPGY